MLAPSALSCVLCRIMLCVAFAPIVNVYGAIGQPCPTLASAFRGPYPHPCMATLCLSSPSYPGLKATAIGMCDCSAIWHARLGIFRNAACITIERATLSLSPSPNASQVLVSFFAPSLRPTPYFMSPTMLVISVVSIATINLMHHLRNTCDRNHGMCLRLLWATVRPVLFSKNISVCISASLLPTVNFHSNWHNRVVSSLSSISACPCSCIIPNVLGSRSLGICLNVFLIDAANLGLYNGAVTSMSIFIGVASVGSSGFVFVLAFLFYLLYVCLLVLFVPMRRCLCVCLPFPVLCSRPFVLSSCCAVVVPFARSLWLDRASVNV